MSQTCKSLSPGLIQYTVFGHSPNSAAGHHPPKRLPEPARVARSPMLFTLTGFFLAKSIL
jgi:hypothetical protein